MALVPALWNPSVIATEHSQKGLKNNTGHRNIDKHSKPKQHTQHNTTWINNTLKPIHLVTKKEYFGNAKLFETGFNVAVEITLRILPAANPGGAIRAVSRIYQYNYPSYHIPRL